LEEEAAWGQTTDGHDGVGFVDIKVHFLLAKQGSHLGDGFSDDDLDSIDIVRGKGFLQILSQRFQFLYLFGRDVSDRSHG
jgi:hypothetical protein